MAAGGKRGRRRLAQWAGTEAMGMDTGSRCGGCGGRGADDDGVTNLSCDCDLYPL
jgi:hypothetical protein